MDEPIENPQKIPYGRIRIGVDKNFYWNIGNKWSFLFYSDQNLNKTRMKTNLKNLIKKMMIILEDNGILRTSVMYKPNKYELSAIIGERNQIFCIKNVGNSPWEIEFPIVRNIFTFNQLLKIINKQMKSKPFRIQNFKLNKNCLILQIIN